MTIAIEFQSMKRIYFVIFLLILTNTGLCQKINFAEVLDSISNCRYDVPKHNLCLIISDTIVDRKFDSSCCYSLKYFDNYKSFSRFIKENGTSLYAAVCIFDSINNEGSFKRITILFSQYTRKDLHKRWQGFSVDSYYEVFLKRTDDVYKIIGIKRPGRFDFGN
jgi:hypothetical protein